jgi:hypothetical protein
MIQMQCSILMHTDGWLLPCFMVAALGALHVTLSCLLCSPVTAPTLPYLLESQYPASSLVQLPSVVQQRKHWQPHCKRQAAEGCHRFR